MKAIKIGAFGLLIQVTMTVSAFGAGSCPKGEHQVEAHLRKSYIKYDGTSVKATRVRKHCRKNPRGYELWSSRLSNKRPKVWGYKKEKTKKWIPEETERLYDALSVLPDIFLKLKQVKIYRMSLSQEAQNPATTNPPLLDVTLYDLAFVHKDSLSQIISHELSHILFDQLNQFEKEKFAQASDWITLKIRGDVIYAPKKGRKFLQQDSAMSLDEDFANHIEEYLFNQDNIRKLSPKSEAWIRKKYGKDFKLRKRTKK